MSFSHLLCLSYSSLVYQRTCCVSCCVSRFLWSLLIRLVSRTRLRVELTKCCGAAECFCLKFYFQLSFSQCRILKIVSFQLISSQNLKMVEGVMRLRNDVRKRSTVKRYSVSWIIIELFFKASIFFKATPSSSQCTSAQSNRRQSSGTGSTAPVSSGYTLKYWLFYFSEKNEIIEEPDELSTVYIFCHLIKFKCKNLKIRTNLTSQI